MSSRAFRQAAAVLSVFTLLFSWLFANSLVQGTYLSESDLYDFYLPIFLAPRMAWSSFEFAGLPVFADPENASWYPLHLFFSRVVGPGPVSWTAFVVSAYVVAACGMYAYVYVHTRSKAGAAFAGLAFALSEAAMERMVHQVILHSLAWTPVVFLALDGLNRPRRWPWVIAGALAAACCVLAGHPQIALYLAYIGGAYAIAIAVADGGGLRYLASVGVMAAGAALMCAITLLPVIEASSIVATTSRAFKDFVEYSETPARLLSALYPTIPHVGRETPTYVGMATLLLAPLGLWRPPSRWRAIFWLVLVVVSVLVSLGRATPLASMMYELPLYSSFRIVARHLVFAAFGASVLAGFGVAALAGQRISSRALAAAAAGLLLAMVAGAAAIHAWPESFAFHDIDAAAVLELWNDTIGVQFCIALLAIVACLAVGRMPGSVPAVALLLVVLAGDLIYSLPYRMTPRGLMLETLAPEMLVPSVHARALAGHLREHQQRLLSSGGLRDEVVHSLFARVWRIPTLGGYSSLMPTRVSVLGRIEMSGRIDPTVLSDHDLGLDLLAVRYLVVRTSLAVEHQVYYANTARWREVTRFRTARDTDRDVDEDARHEDGYIVYENKRALPRVWLAREALVTTDGAVEDAIRTATFRDGRPFLPADTALIEEGDGPAMARTGRGGTAAVTSVEDGEIVARVSSPEGGFLVLSEAYYPGWRARVDGQEWQPVTRTDMALQGIQVPPGDHAVTFALTSRPQRAGTALSLFGLAAAAASGIVIRRRGH